jgi:SAM-dependent methyltransferase
VGEPAIPAVPGKFSCVVDVHPRFHLDALRWFASLTRLAGVAATDLVVHAVCPAETDALGYLAAHGVTVRRIRPFDPRSPHCNKISGALALAAERVEGLAVLTDSDVVFCEDPRRLQIPADRVAMTPVHMANPPLEVLAGVFAASGLARPRHTAIPWQPGELTVAGNGNGGLYLVPADLLGVVAQAWERWARWLLERIELLATCAIHVDQVAMALALSAEGIDTCELDIRWNLPIHVPAIIPADPPVPAAIHYHQQVDVAGQIIGTGTAAIDRRIAEANAALDRVWSEAFPNATFWEWRYLTHPELGSGVGSRGQPLADKRALLAAVIEVLHPASTLDVGCGDGEATRGIEMPSYVGLDLSAEGVRRARAGHPEREYRVGSLAQHPLRGDLTVCLDVLLHQAEPEVYENLVERLLGSAVRALLVSGYEHPFPATVGTVHFHEPLSRTLRRRDPAVEIYPLREDHPIATFLVLKASPAGGDVKAEMVRECFRLLAHPTSALRGREAECEALVVERDAASAERDAVSAELDRWRERVAAMEATRAWRLRAWLLRLRQWRFRFRRRSD